MPRPAVEVADRIAQRARGTDAFVGRLETLHDSKKLSRLDVERGYAGAYLSFFALYEQAWEDLFFGLLMQRLTHPRPVARLADIQSEVKARQMVMGRLKGYLDWLPPGQTIERAQIFLSSGRPFADMPDADKGVLARNIAIRNALAHASAHSLRTFKTKVVGSSPLPPNELRPAGYLRGAVSQDQTRMNLALAELTLVLRRLCT